MTHLGERLTDFIFGELPQNEMEDARRHVAACGDCRDQVQQFERTCSLLKASPDVEPPRRIVFEYEKRRPLWNWLVPAAVAAAIVVAVLIALPVQVHWNSSQLTIVMGKAQSPAAIVPPLTTSSAQAIPQPIDYERIAKEVQNSDRAWLVDELKKHDAEQMKEIRLSLKGNWDYLTAEQQRIEKETVENAVNIQRVVQRAAQPSEGQ